MKAGLVALLALLGACRPLVYVGSAEDGSIDGPVTDGPRDDAGAGDDGRDVPDETADVPDATAPEERLGIGGRGLAVTYDGVVDDRAIRFVYVGDDGDLHVERRDSETLSRLCERTFAPPAGYALVSAPTVPVTSGVVLVSAREVATGTLRVIAMVAQSVPTPCGDGFSPWAALPDAPDGQRLASAPGASTLPLVAADGGPRVWAFALTDRGALLQTDASLGTSPLAWSPWTTCPPIPAGERRLSAPVAAVGSGRSFYVNVLTESSQGRRHFLQLVFDAPSRAWTPAWEILDPDAHPPDTALSVALFEIDRRYVRDAVPYGAWRLFRAQTGAYWAQAWVDRADALPGYGAWSNVGNPFADRGIKPGLPVFAPRRNARVVAGEILVLSTPTVGPRVVRYSSTWFDTLEDPPGRWREAPDPLR